LMKYQVELEP